MDLTISTKFICKDNSFVLHENLMKVPFYLNIVGNGTSGKTVLIANIIDKFKSVFKKNRVIVFTSSFSDILENLKDTHGIHIVCDGVEDRVSQLLQFQKERKEAGLKVEHILIIFDDFITNNELNKRRGIFTKLWSTARHYNISLIITSQEYRLIPAPLRKLAFYQIIYKINNTVERNAFINENNNWLSEFEFEQYYDIATKERYNFLFIMIREGKLLRNFEEVLNVR